MTESSPPQPDSAQSNPRVSVEIAGGKAVFRGRESPQAYIVTDRVLALEDWR